MCPDATDVGITDLANPRATILLVEDEVLIRCALAEFLRESGFDVIEAAHPGEARAALLSVSNIDLVFSDVHMPGGDGVTLAQWVEENAPGLPIILASATPDVFEEAKRLCGNVAAYISKPFAFEIAQEHVADALTRRILK